MPAKAAKRVRKPQPKARAVSTRKRVWDQTEESTPSDGDEALLRCVLEAPKTQTATGLHTLLYNSTPSMHKLAYKYGFTVGKLLQMKYKTVESLLALLEKSGLGPVLYSPSADVSHIHSTTKRRHPNIGGRAHHYECGIIAGYFSSYTNNTITTSELQCRFADSNSCTFVSGAVVEPEPVPKINTKRVVMGLSQMMGEYEEGAVHADPYTMLALRPLFNGGMTAGVSALLYLASKSLPRAASSKEEVEMLGNIGRFLGTKAIFAKSTKAKKSVAITYSLYNSTSPYIGLTLPAFTGYLSWKYERPAVEIRRIMNGTYVASLTLKTK